MKKNALFCLLIFSFAWSCRGAWEWENELPAVPRKRVLPQILFFAQAQLKYPLNTRTTNYSYYERWTDWPLFLNAAPDGTASYGVLSDADYVFSANILKNYGMNGFSVFLPSNKKIDRSSVLWSDFASRKPDNTLLAAWDGNSQPDAVALAVNSRASLKIGDKTALLFYAAYPAPKRKPLIAELRKKYPDKVLLLLTDEIYDSSFENKLNNGTLTLKDIESIRQKLRETLRDGDGFYLSRRPRNSSQNGILNLRLYELLVRIVSGVMAEPEFQKKLLVLTAGIEHNNSYNIGFSLVSDGTATLRGFLDVALKYNPDIINIPEWDEQNENTSLRPTVFKGLSMMRIMRYYTEKAKGTHDFSLPGDDLNIPNLIVSTRKMLVLGEKFKLELLHLPDGKENKTYMATVMLKNEKGETVHTFPPVSFSADTFTADNLVLPSEKFAAEQVLIPELQIATASGRTLQFSGFGATALVPTAINDYEEFHQGLRDMIIPRECALKLSPLPDGDSVITGKLEFKENVRNLELLENGRCVYSFSDNGSPSWRDDQKYAVLDVSLMSALLPMKVSGEITVSSPQAAWKVLGVVNPGLNVRKERLFFSSMNLSNWEARALVSIPGTELQTAKIHVNIPGFCEKTFSFADLAARDHYAIYGEKGFVISFNRQYRQAGHALPQDRKSFDMLLTLRPERRDSVFQFQAVTPEGRQWRSVPLLALSGQKSQMRKIQVFSDTENRPVTLQVGANRVEDIRYELTDRYGTSLPVSAGRCYWASRGGYLLHSTYKGGGATSLYAIGNLPANSNYPADAVCGVPELKGEDGTAVLNFDGKGNFITLPQGVLPRRTAYSMTMEIAPDKDFSGNCLLIGSSTCRGAHGGLRIFVRNGKLAFEFMNKELKCTFRDTGIVLPTGVWSKLRISRDLEKLTFELDGKIAGEFACPGIGVNDTLSIVGGSGQKHDYFKGKIKALSIQHYIER